MWVLAFRKRLKEFKSERSFKMIKIRNEAEEDYKIVEEITRKAAYGIFI